MQLFNYKWLIMVGRYESDIQGRYGIYSINGIFRTCIQIRVEAIIDNAVSIKCLTVIPDINHFASVTQLGEFLLLVQVTSYSVH